MITPLSLNRSSVSEYLTQSKNTNLSASFVKTLDETIFNLSSFNTEEYNQFSIDELYQYLVLSHRLFLNHWLPKIDQTVGLLAQKNKRNSLLTQVLKLFLTKYRIELVRHMQEEEEVLFVYIENKLKGKQRPEEEQLAINHFLNTHNDNIVLHLGDLKKDLLHFNTDLNDSLVFQILFNQLNLFQRELTVHSLIEDQVVVPRIMAHQNKA
jgi:regulator of cell morphogenesis and NO signaling